MAEPVPTRPIIPKPVPNCTEIVPLPETYTCPENCTYLLVLSSRKLSRNLYLPQNSPYSIPKTVLLPYSTRNKIQTHNVPIIPTVLIIPKTVPSLALNRKLSETCTLALQFRPYCSTVSRKLYCSPTVPKNCTYTAQQYPENCTAHLDVKFGQTVPHCSLQYPKN